MQDENELLWRLYQDHVIHGRHHETLRATTTTVILAVAAGVLGLLGARHDWPPHNEDLPLTLFLILIGVFGALFTAKYHERFVFHTNRARAYRDVLDKNLPNVGINNLRPIADAKTQSEHPWLYKRRLYRFWIGLHLIIAVLGCLLALLILQHWQAERQVPVQVTQPAGSTR